MNQYNQAIHERITAHIAAGNTQESVAKQAGMSPATLNGYIKQNYTGSISNTEHKLEEFFRLVDLKAAHMEKAEFRHVAEDYMPTTVSKGVYSAIRYCQLERGFVVVFGDSGIGKTTAAEKYLKDNPSTCVLLTVSPVLGNLGSFLKLLARALRLPEKCAKDDLVMMIRDKLQGTNIVLVIDEAQHLKYLTLEEIRMWCAKNSSTGKPGVGIVLMGNDQVYSRMLGRQEAMFAQQFNRTRIPVEYRTVDITEQDTAMLFPLLADGNHNKEFKLIHAVCQSKWGIRGAIDVYTGSFRNDTPNYEGMVAMAREKRAPVA